MMPGPLGHRILDRHYDWQRFWLAISLCLTTGIETATAQCSKPAIPAGGLPVSVIANQLVTYADGYKTKGDLVIPNAPTPSCGWPVVVFVHGLGANRSSDRIEQWGIAMNGYAVWTYDVRGQGDAVTLNGATLGHSFDGSAEKYDLAEQITFARASFPSLLSQALVAVTGFSQGGIHSWAAAALSGRVVTAPGRPMALFPKIAAVAPRSFVAEPIEVRVQDGTFFERSFIEYVAATPTTAVLDPAFHTLTQNAFLADNPKSLNLAFQLEPLRPVWNLLPSTAVPVLWGHAFHDEIRSPQSGLDALATLPATTPWRAMLGSGGHGAPENDQQWALWNVLRLRWFDRFLWNEANDVDQEARILSFLPPLDPLTLRDKAALWSSRSDTKWPPVNSLAVRLYLTASGSLDPTPPTSAGTPTTINHQPQGGYSPNAYFTNWNERQTNTVLARIPLSERTFRTLPLPLDLEFAGPVRVHLAFVPNAPAVQLTALLRVLVPGATQPMTIAVHGKASRTEVPNQASAFEFDLGSVATNLPIGSIVELIVRNHWLREAPWANELVAVPLFTPFALTLMHGNTAVDASWVEVTYRPRQGVGLVSATVSTLVAAPAPILLDIRGGTNRAGSIYVIAGTLSGHDPYGILPIRIDALTDVLLAVANSALAPGFIGLLDGSGNAQAGLDLPSLAPLPPQLAGQRITFAGCIFDPALPFGVAVSAPLDVHLR